MVPPFFGLQRIVPFTIRIPDAVLADLKARLARARFPPPLQAGWTHGTDVDYLKNLVTYWRDKFDWRAQEKKLNQFNHFTNLRRLEEPGVQLDRSDPRVIPQTPVQLLHIHIQRVDSRRAARATSA